MLGTPTEASWPGVSSLAHWSSKLPRFRTPRSGLGGALAGAVGGDAAGAGLLKGMLSCDPAARFSADHALRHRYLADLDCTGHEHVPGRALAAASAASKLAVAGGGGGGGGGRGAKRAADEGGLGVGGCRGV